MNELNILSVNVRGLNSSEKRYKIYTWIKEKKEDVAFLQKNLFKSLKTNITFIGMEHPCMHFQILSLVEGSLFFFGKN